MDGSTPLLHAAQFGHSDVAQLLLEHGADTDVRDVDGSTPLLHAAQFGHSDVAQLLLGYGADTEVRDKYGLKPLSYAEERMHQDIVQLLLFHGANLGSKSDLGHTASLSATEKVIGREQRALNPTPTISPPTSETPELPDQGVLLPPREKLIGSGLSPKNAGKRDRPPKARQTKIDRRLVDLAALEEGNGRYEEMVGYFGWMIVHGVLTDEETDEENEEYTVKTQEIREQKSASGIPPNARWTKINRELVDTAALEEGNESYKEMVDYVIVLRVLTKEEIMEYAARTREIRKQREDLETVGDMSD